MKSVIQPEETLRRAGLKVTATRLLVLAEFAKNPVPISALDIHTTLEKKGTDVVTIYRTLASFEESGMIRKVDLRRDSVYYELSSHHHHHIVCTSCGVVEDVEDCGIEQMAKKIGGASKKFSHIKDHALEFFGVCRSCVSV